MDEPDHDLKTKDRNPGAASFTLNSDHVVVWNLSSYSTLSCLKGSLWLTRTKDPKDDLLKTGQSMIVPPGQWVVQAFEPSQIERKARFVTKEVRDVKTTVLPVLQRL